MAAVDWTQIIVAMIAGLPAIIAAFYAHRIRAEIKTPSGDTLGVVAERTHDLTSADLALTTIVHHKVTNGGKEP